MVEAVSPIQYIVPQAEHEPNSSPKHRILESALLESAISRDGLPLPGYNLI